jgi:hypothetical protein
MNKKRPGEAVPNQAVLETRARAANAEPWEPMPGMVKRQCPSCDYFFAAPADSREQRCPDCVEKPPRGRTRWA